MKYLQVKKLSTILLVALLASCSSSPKTEDAEQPPLEDITITKAQFDASGMKFGQFERYSFENTVKVNGEIGLSPQGHAKVGTYISGVITHNSLSVGEYVEKGQHLFTLSSSESIQLQQEYAEMASKFNAIKSDYERQKSLANEGIASQKDFLNIEGEYKSMQAKCEGLKARLKLVNISVLKAEEGFVSSDVKVYAPISGYVTAQNGVLGQFVEPQKVIMEIIDASQFILKLYVFEKDIYKLAKNQSIRFYSPNAKNEIHPARLILIGKSINSETKTIDCTGQLSNPDRKQFVNGTSIEAEIITDNRDAMALPDDALVKSGDSYYILAKKSESSNQIVLHKQKVSVGKTYKGYTEIITDSIVRNVLVSGVQTITID